MGRVTTGSGGVGTPVSRGGSPRESTQQEAVQSWMIYIYITFTIKGELLRWEGLKDLCFTEEYYLMVVYLFIFLATLGQANLSGLFLFFSFF